MEILQNHQKQAYGHKSVKNDREGSKVQGFPNPQIKPPPPGHPGQQGESLSQNSNVRKGPLVLPRCVVTAYHTGDFRFHCQRATSR